MSDKGLKIGYVITSHISDYHNLKATFRKTEFNSNRIVLVLSGDASVDKISKIEDEIRGYIKEAYLSEECKSSIQLTVYTVTKPCLLARYCGYRSLIGKYPDTEFIQFLDGGDFLDPLESEDILQLIQAEEDLFWAPVSVAVDELKNIINNERDYWSFSWDPLSRLSWSTRYIHVKKEDFDKIINGSKLILVGSNEQRMNYDNDIELRDANNFRNLEKDSFDDNYILGDFNEKQLSYVGFSMLCPSITAYPWRTHVVDKVFEFMKEFSISMEVNLGEDLLFHTIARHLFENNGEVTCKRIASKYNYRYYPTSLTHKESDVAELIKLNQLRGFCADLITDKHFATLPKELSKSIEPESVTCEAVPKEPIKIKCPNCVCPEYKGVKLEPVCYSAVSATGSKKLLCWNDGSIPEIQEVIAYIPNVKYPVVTNSSNYQHCALIPEEKDWKSGFTDWLVSGYRKHTSAEVSTPFSVKIRWGNSDKGELYKLIGDALELQLSEDFEITQMTNLTELKKKFSDL